MCSVCVARTRALCCSHERVASLFGAEAQEDKDVEAPVVLHRTINAPHHHELVRSEEDDEEEDEDEEEWGRSVRGGRGARRR